MGPVVAKIGFPKGLEQLHQYMLRLAHPQLRLKQQLLRLQDRNGNLVGWVVVDT